MKIQALSSGSKGNCSILLGDSTNLIIDMGITYLTLKNTLEEENISLDSFAGILITHNHKDHISGLASLIKKTNIQCIIPHDMYDSIKEYVPYERCLFIEENDKICNISIELIHTSHDAPCSVGFIFEENDKSLVYVTDTGYINRKYLQKMINKSCYLIESNHDEVMLMEGPYPRFLKERVISDYGHLSNTTTARYLKKIIGDKTKNIILAHVSEANNTYDLAYETTKKEIDDETISIIVARQREVSNMIEV